MGCQSQLRIGAFKSAKKKGTKAKHPRIGSQRTIDGRVAFNKFKDCIVCIAKKKKFDKVAAAILHQAHYKLCPSNRKTKGWMSDRSVFVEAEATRNIAINNAPIVPVPWLNIRPVSQNQTNLFPLFASASASNKSPAANDGPSLENTRITYGRQISSTFQNVSKFTNPTNI